MTRLAILALAAGSSRRFGAADKMLAAIDGEPLVARTIGQLEAVAIDGVTIMLLAVVPDLDGGVAEAIRRRVPTTRLVANPRHAAGLATSVAAGIAALPADTAGVMITPSDMPGLDTAFVKRLLMAFCDREGRALDRPVYSALADGTAVAPMVWPRRMFPALLALSGDTGGRHLLRHEAAIAVAISDEQAADIDTPVDLAALSAK